MMTTFMHVPVCGGVVTAAIEVCKEYVTFGLAFCNPGDRFVRKVGLTVAASRLYNSSHPRTNKHRISLMLNTAEGAPALKTQVAHEMARYLDYSVKAPAWAQGYGYQIYWSVPDDQYTQTAVW